MTGVEQEDSSHAAKFMLQEHSRIIDAYHDLHVQKNELIKVYLTFASLPIAIVTLFLGLFKYLQPSVQTKDLTDALRIAAICLSVLLVFVGASILMSMLKIKGEQYLYIQAINEARNYFKREQHVPEIYLVLPCSRHELTFGQKEPSGRAFWEVMIVGAPNSLLLAFLAGDRAYHVSCLHDHALLVSVVTFLLAALVHVFFVQWWIKATLTKLGIRVL